MKSILKKWLFNFQKILVLGMRCAYPFSNRSKLDNLVVGVETASVLKNLSEILGSDSINLSSNRFYDFIYTYEPSKKPFVVSLLYRCYLLSCVVPRYRNITYVGGSGLIDFCDDGRHWEFEFVKSTGINIVCIYTGTDIRSFRKMLDMPIFEDMDTVATYHPYILNSSFEDREINVEKLSLATDQFADMVFNLPTEQISYMESDVEYLPYMLPDEIFELSTSNKWLDVEKLIVLHCPSSPIPKGTQIVRAAVKKLQTLGYEFEYIELIGVAHDKVLSELSRAHIVLNEFYAFVPGVFGLEAMAANSVLLTSADKNIESMLPEGANDAWLVTPYWNVFDNLKDVMDAPVVQLQRQAERGRSWAKLNGSYSNAKKQLNQKYERL